jgi:hypothetical protein
MPLSFRSATPRARDRTEPASGSTAAEADRLTSARTVAFILGVDTVACVHRDELTEPLLRSRSQGDSRAIREERAPCRQLAVGSDSHELQAWARSHSVGRMIGDPSVVAEARQAHGVDPKLVRRGNVAIVVYSRTRVYLDRDAWEMLPDDGVLFMQVRPTGERSYSLAFTSAELAAVFGEVRSTKSWDRARCYHFPKAPVAISAFRVAA